MHIFLILCGLFFFCTGCKISVRVPEAILPDTTAPIIESLSAPAEGSYTQGQVLNFTLNMSENVTVDTSVGVPTMDVEIAGVNRSAAYTSGSGSQQLLFQYTVQAAEDDTDGIEIKLPLHLNGGVIRDDSQNNLTDLSFYAPMTSDVLVDNTSPAITLFNPPASAIYTVAQNLDVVLNFSEIVNVSTLIGTPRIALNVGGNTRYANYYSGSGSQQLTFRYVIQAGEMDSDGIEINSPVELQGGGIQDRAQLSGDLSFSTLTSYNGITVNTTLAAPQITSIIPPADKTYLTHPSEPLEFKVNFSEDVNLTGFGFGAALKIHVGDSIGHAYYQGGSGTSSLAFVYSPSYSDEDTDGIVLNSSWDFSSGGLVNASGVAVSTTIPAPFIPIMKNVKVDSSPSVQSITFTNGTYTFDQTINFTVTFSEAVVGTGSRLELNVGGTTVHADYLSGTGRNIITFAWTNPGGLDDLTDGIEILSPIDLNGGTLLDSAGNDADLRFAPPNTSLVKVDGTFPPKDLSYYGVDNFTFLPGPSAGKIYANLSPKTGLTFALNSALSAIDLDTRGDITYQQTITAPVSRTITASNSAGSASGTLALTALPVIYKNQISINDSEACALASGGVYCWDPSTSNTPSQKYAPGTGVEMIAGAGNKTYAVVNNRLYSWSAGGSPQPYSPALASDETTVANIGQLAVGPNHSCYLRFGRAYCFNNSEPTPQLVSHSHYFSKLAVGTNHSCGISGVNLYCWGNNSFSQLGDSTTTSSSNPVLARTAHDVALGDGFTCALYAGSVFCFGRNDKLQLGRVTDSDNGVTTSATLNDQQTLHSVSQISIHPEGDYVLTLRDGVLYGWGKLTKLNSSLPNSLPYNLEPYAGNIVAGKEMAYLLKQGSSSQTSAWFKYGSTDAIPLFNPKASFSSMSAGYSSTCLHLSATPHCFGPNADNQLTSREIETFLPLNNLFGNDINTSASLNKRTITSSVHGENHSCYLAQNKLICNGIDRNEVGALGNGDIATDSSSGVLVRLLTVASRKLCSGTHFTCAQGVDHQVRCWGDNSEGQIAPSATAHFTNPQLLSSAGEVLDLACMDKSLCILKNDQKIYCQGEGFGNGVFGQILTGGPDFIRLKAAGNFGCAQTEDSNLVCFGLNNDFGQLGSTTALPDTTNGVMVINEGVSPIRGKVLDFTLGRRHACASVYRPAPGQTFYCWGDNTHGQVDQNGTLTPKEATSIALPNGSAIYDLAAGERHTCIHLNGGFQCFGHKDQVGVDSDRASLSDLNPILPLIYR